MTKTENIAHTAVSVAVCGGDDKDIVTTSMSMSTSSSCLSLSTKTTHVTIVRMFFANIYHHHHAAAIF